MIHPHVIVLADRNMTRHQILAQATRADASPLAVAL